MIKEIRNVPFTDMLESDGNGVNEYIEGRNRLKIGATDYRCFVCTKGTTLGNDNYIVCQLNMLVLIEFVIHSTRFQYQIYSKVYQECHLLFLFPVDYTYIYQKEHIMG